jgi:transcriptional regulator with XRE-family HTH domain
MTIQFSKLWSRLGASRRYRNQFVSAQAGRAFAFQLRAIMKKRKITQEELAELSGLTQGVISRAADPDYGKLTTTVKVKIANGLDMAYLGILLPFSDAAKWFLDLSEESVQVKTFEEEEDSAVGDLGFANLEAARKPVQRESNAKGIAMVGKFGDAERLGSYLKNQQDQAA